MFPSITAVYAALLALLFVALSLWVIMKRVSSGTMQGDGHQDDLSRRIRSHGNFAEYVPLALLLIALLEASGAAQGLIQALGGLLLIARLAHPFGMTAPVKSPRELACRGGGAIGTVLVTVIAAFALLVRLA